MADGPTRRTGRSEAKAPGHETRGLERTTGFEPTTLTLAMKMRIRYRGAELPAQVPFAERALAARHRCGHKRADGGHPSQRIALRTKGWSDVHGPLPQEASRPARVRHRNGTHRASCISHLTVAPEPQAAQRPLVTESRSSSSSPAGRSGRVRMGIRAGRARRSS